MTNEKELVEGLPIKLVLNYLVRIGVLQSWEQKSDRTFELTFN